MTNLKSRFTAITAAGLVLVAVGAAIALIHWDLHRLIYAGDSKGFDFHLLLISIVCAIPGVLLAFLLGYFVRLGTNPETNWILPSIVLGAGAAIVTRTVVNKVQTERKEAQQQKVFEARKAAETGSIYLGSPLIGRDAAEACLLPPAGAIPVDDLPPINRKELRAYAKQQQQTPPLPYNQDLYEKVIRQTKK